MNKKVHVILFQMSLTKILSVAGSFETDANIVYNDAYIYDTTTSLWSQTSTPAMLPTGSPSCRRMADGKVEFKYIL